MKRVAFIGDQNGKASQEGEPRRRAKKASQEGEPSMTRLCIGHSVRRASAAANSIFTSVMLELIE
jgi:hypothetical protein